MDIIIEEAVLDKYIEETNASGDSQHKGIYQFLKSIRMLGYLHREKHRIILQSGDYEADLDDEYAKYLDKRASGINIKFNED